MEPYQGRWAENYEWDLGTAGDTLFNLDGEVWTLEPGWGTDGHIVDPRRILDGSLFVPNRSHPGSNTHGTLFTGDVRGPWPTRGGTDKGQPLPEFHGYPISGIGGGHGEPYRAALTETAECGVGDHVGPTMDVVHGFEHKYFYIASDAGGTRYYLECDTTACSWVTGEPTLRWTWGATSGTHSAPHNGVLVAHDSGGSPLGHLDRSECDQLEHVARLYNGTRCGTGRWRYDGTRLTEYDDITFLSKDGRLCHDGYCSGPAHVTLEPAPEWRPDRVKVLRFTNGSFVRCDKTEGLCVPHPTATQVFTLDWNWAGAPAGAAPYMNVGVSAPELPICLVVYEVGGGGVWEPVGSITYGALGANTLLLDTSNMCNPLKAPVNVEVLEAGQKLVETTGGGITSVEVSNGGAPAVRAEPANVSWAPADVVWITDDSPCPSGSYAERFYPTDDKGGHAVACRRARPPCDVGGSSAPAGAQCPPGQVAVHLNFTGGTLRCANLTVTPGSSVGPSSPYVGALSSKRDSSGVDDSYAIDTNTWKGTPLQAITGTTKKELWHYGRQCYVKFGDATFLDRVNHDVVYEGGEDAAARCREENQFVTHLQCLTADCSEGFNITCQTAPTCRISASESHFVDTPRCPPGQAVVAVACAGEVPDRPCDQVRLKCAPVHQDATLRPSVGPARDSTGDPSPATLVAATGGLALFLLSFTALCICFGPDGDAVAPREVVEVSYRF
jgi:hypothetical protein